MFHHMGFNSSLVLLEALSARRASLAAPGFQFQLGSIRSPAGIVAGADEGTCFNSSLVLLEGKKIENP